MPDRSRKAAPASAAIGRAVQAQTAVLAIVAGRTFVTLFPAEWMISSVTRRTLSVEIVVNAGRVGCADVSPERLPCQFRYIDTPS